MVFSPSNAQMAQDQNDQQVYLWDTGPRKPKMPEKPIPPKNTGDEGEYRLAMLEFDNVLEEYQRALRAFAAARNEFQEWHKSNGGPVEIQQWSVDAKDTLEREPNRYYVSSRTRGHESKPNFGLPPGMRPGHGQAELERRRQEGDEMIEAARRADPIFGDQNLRA